MSAAHAPPSASDPAVYQHLMNAGTPEASEMLPKITAITKPYPCELVPTATSTPKQQLPVATASSSGGGPNLTASGSGGGPPPPSSDTPDEKFATIVVGQVAANEYGVTVVLKSETPHSATFRVIDNRGNVFEITVFETADGSPKLDTSSLEGTWLVATLDDERPVPGFKYTVFIGIDAHKRDRTQTPTLSRFSSPSTTELRIAELKEDIAELKRQKIAKLEAELAELEKLKRIAELKEEIAGLKKLHQQLPSKIANREDELTAMLSGTYQ